MARLLITGAAGFIGSAVCRRALAHGHSVLAFDALTYAGNVANLAGLALEFAKGDIADPGAVAHAMDKHDPDFVIHLAAESHVDRSITNPLEFVRTNVVGTAVLLEAARSRDIDFVHVSTDEVYGDLGPGDAPFSEESNYAPSSPYSASKAGSDHLARAYRRTYGLGLSVTNCSNNYGPRQFPEKLVPVVISKALSGQGLPIYGTGEQIRDWLHVDDHAAGILAVADRGLGSDFMFGGNSERTNIQVVDTICAALDELRPKPVGSYLEQKTYVDDRPGHDQRYAVDCSKASEQLGWQPSRSFENGLRDTVQWYLDNDAWCEQVSSGAYRNLEWPV